MNKNVWMKIFKGYLECYNSINTLQKSIIDKEEADSLKVKLLEEIIITFESEVEK